MRCHNARSSGVCVFGNRVGLLMEKSDRLRQTATLSRAVNGTASDCPFSRNRGIRRSDVRQLPHHSRHSGALVLMPRKGFRGATLPRSLSLVMQRQQAAHLRTASVFSSLSGAATTIA